MRLAIVEEQKKGSRFVERLVVVEESQRKEEEFVVAEIARGNRRMKKVVEEEERQREVIDSQLRECRVDQVEEQKERQEVEAFSKGKVAEKEEERSVAKKVEVLRIDLRKDLVAAEKEFVCKERIEERHAERVERVIVVVCREIVFSVHR